MNYVSTDDAIILKKCTRLWGIRNVIDRPETLSGDLNLQSQH
jgi:hypothetical protein